MTALWPCPPRCWLPAPWTAAAVAGSLSRLKVLQPQGHQLVPVATFEQNGRTVAADSLNKAGVAGNRGDIRHGDVEPGRTVVRGRSGAIIGRVRGGWYGGEQRVAQRRQDRRGPGLQGELRADPASDFPERFTAPGPRWLRSRKGVSRRRSNSKRVGNYPASRWLVVRLEGIDSRSTAETPWAMNCWYLHDRPELEEGEFHLLDLLGLEARLTADGPAVGTVSDLISGGNDLLEITTSEGRKC